MSGTGSDGLDLANSVASVAPTASWPEPVNSHCKASFADLTGDITASLSVSGRVGLERKARLIMILQILADAGQIEFDVDALRGKLAGGPDAGGEQQHRRIDRAAGQDQFAPRADALDLAVALDLDADGAAALEQDAAHMGPGHQFEIAPAKVRLEIADRGRTAPAIVDVERREADAVDALAVEIRIALVLQPLAGLDKGLGDRRRPLDVARPSSGRRCRATHWRRRRSAPSA